MQAALVVVLTEKVSLRDRRRSVATRKALRENRVPVRAPLHLKSYGDSAGLVGRARNRWEEEEDGNDNGGGARG